MLDCHRRYPSLHLRKHDKRRSAPSHHGDLTSADVLSQPAPLTAATRSLGDDHFKRQLSGVLSVC